MSLTGSVAGLSAAKARYTPGSFVTATRDDGTLLHGFIERIVDAETNMGISPRSRRGPRDRFLVRPLVVGHMPYAEYGPGPEGRNGKSTSLSDTNPASDRAMLRMQPAEIFLQKSLKPMVRPGWKRSSDKDDDDDDDDDDDEKPAAPFDGTDAEIRLFDSLHKELSAEDDGRFSVCYVCGQRGELLLCESCVLCSHKLCAGVTKELTVEWRCAVCNGRPHAIAGAVHFREAIIDLVDAIAAHDIERVFQVPPQIRFLVADYTRAVEHPVDFSMIREKALNSCYLSLRALIDDVTHMVGNCKSYNIALRFYVQYASDFLGKATTEWERVKKELRDANVDAAIPLQVMSIAAFFGSKEQARAIDPVSVSVADIAPPDANGAAAGRRRKRRGGAVGPKVALCNRGLPPAVRTMNDLCPLPPLVFPNLDFIDKKNLLTDDDDDDDDDDDGEDDDQQRCGAAVPGTTKRPSSGKAKAAQKLLYSAVRVTLVAPPCFKYEHAAGSPPQMLYTLDGTDPSKSDAPIVYNGKPFVVDRDVRVRAVALVSPQHFADSDKKAVSKAATVNLVFASEPQIAQLVKSNARKEQRAARMRQRAQAAAAGSSFSEGDDELHGGDAQMKATGQVNNGADEDDDPFAMATQNGQTDGDAAAAAAAAAAASSVERRRQRVVSFADGLTELKAPPPSRAGPALAARSQQQVLPFVVQQPGAPHLQQLNYKCTRNASRVGRAAASKRPPAGTAHTAAAAAAAAAPATASTGLAAIPASWFKPQWVELFVEQLQLHPDLTRDELSIYTKCAMRVSSCCSGGGGAMLQSCSTDGIHTRDWERFYRDYLLFISLNSEATVLPTGFMPRQNGDEPVSSDEDDDSDANEAGPRPAAQSVVSVGDDGAATAATTAATAGRVDGDEEEHDDDDDDDDGERRLVAGDDEQKNDEGEHGTGENNL